MSSQRARHYKLKHVKKETKSQRKRSSKPSTTNIRKWLRKYKLTDYESAFIQNSITVEQLMHLNNDQILSIAKNTIQIDQILHHKRFLNAVLNTKELTHNDKNSNNNNGGNMHMDPQSESKSNPSQSLSFTSDSINIISDSSRNKETGGGGYKLYLFEDKNEALKYQCSICHDICRQSVQLECCKHNHNGTYYCKLCIKLYLKNNANVCPINNQHSDTVYFVNRYMRKRVNNLIVHCPRSSKALSMNHKHHRIEEKKCDNDSECGQYCEWNGKLSDLLNHIGKECKFYKRKRKLKHNNNDLIRLCDANKQQIEALMKKIDIQHHQITHLKQEHKSLKSKLKKNTQDTMQMFESVDKLTKIVMDNYKSTNKYCHPSNKYELYHPKRLIIKKQHSQNQIALIHSKDIEEHIMETKYHPKIRNNDGIWTCCNGSLESNGCSIETTQIMIYPCCGKRDKSEGCMNGYMCCKGNIHSNGCIDVSYYSCCNQQKNNKSNGCSKRYICCKQSYPKSKGCQLKI